MKLTHINLDKLKWLLHTSQFRENKIETLSRVFLWEYHRLRNDAVVLPFDGSEVVVDCRDGIGRMLYYFNGAVDPEIFGYLNRYLRRGFTVVDVGANIGIYTKFAAKRVGPDGVVYSFEPNPEVVKRLEANISTDNVRIMPYALGENSGTIRFQTADDTAKGTIQMTETGSSSTFEVPCLTLDGFHTETMAHRMIDYLKIDVAGADYYVLRGAKKLFAARQVRLVQVECLNDKTAIRDFLLDHGYLLCQLLPTGAMAPLLNAAPMAAPHGEDAPVTLFAHPPGIQIPS